MQTRLTTGLGIILGLLLFASFWQSPLPAQTVPQDHAQIYDRAVKLTAEAEKKLAANFTAEAKALIKEANYLYGILQKELPHKLQERELTLQQEEQWNINDRLGKDSTAQGERLEKAAAEKQKKSDALEAKGEREAAVKLQEEAVRDLALAQKAHLRAAIYHLKNLQLTFSFLKR